MTGRGGSRSPDDPAGRPTGRRARRAAAAWLLLVVAASLVDPGTLLDPVGAPTATGAGGSGGAVAFAAAHLVAYGVLAWLLVGGAGPAVHGSRAVVTAVAVAAAAGVGIELLQAPTVTRTASAADALVNAVGAAVGAGLRAAVERR